MWPQACGQECLESSLQLLFLWLEASFSKHVIPTPGHATFDASENFETGFLLSYSIRKETSFVACHVMTVSLFTVRGANYNFWTSLARIKSCDIEI